MKYTLRDKTEKYVDDALSTFFKGPPGIEVFESNIELTCAQFRDVATALFEAGYNLRERELEQEKIAAYERLLANARLADIKLPWWRRWFMKNPVKPIK